MNILFILLITVFYSIENIDASPSNLDTSFNKNGATTNLFASYTINEAQDITAQTDGKIVTTGFCGDNAIIARYNNDGTLDATFNSNVTPGYTIITIGEQSAAYSLVIQPDDGKIIVAGYTFINNIETGLLIRLNTNGTLDETFGTNQSGYITSTFQSQSRLLGVQLQTDGSIVVTGWVIDDNGLSNALVARFTSTGSLDTTFNSVGYITTLCGSVFTKGRSVKLQADGKIVIAGQAQVDGINGLILIRYTSAGSLDTTFNTTGYAFPFSSYTSSQGISLAIQPDQKIVVVGSTNPTATGFQNQYYTIVRFTSAGQLDTTFAQTGYIISDIGFVAQGVALQNNGQIVTCGFNYTTAYSVIVARYDADGSFDQTFDFSINDATSNSIANAVSIQTDGKILIAGTISLPYQVIQ